MNKARIYVETSVISYLTSRPSKDELTRARQLHTERWLTLARDLAQLECSEFVRLEIARGNPQAAAKRLAIYDTLTVLPIHSDALLFAKRLMEEGLIPISEPEDASHIAQATLTQTDYLLSWNFAHLVNPQMKVRLFNAIDHWGYPPPFLITPEEMNESVFL
jgi:predicted nucleic acid-binding protein